MISKYFEKIAKKIDDAIYKINQVQKNNDLEITNIKKSKLKNFYTLYPTINEAKKNAKPLSKEILSTKTELEQEQELNRVKNLNYINLKSEKILKLIHNIYK